MITMETEGRQPLFGTVVGDPRKPFGCEEAPHIVPSPLGVAISEQWRGIPSYYRKSPSLPFSLCPTTSMAFSLSASISKSLSGKDPERLQDGLPQGLPRPLPRRVRRC